MRENRVLALLLIVLFVASDVSGDGVAFHVVHALAAVVVGYAAFALWSRP